jgi:hypothetical protein
LLAPLRFGIRDLPRPSEKKMAANPKLVKHVPATRKNEPRRSKFLRTLLQQGQGIRRRIGYSTTHFVYLLTMINTGMMKMCEKNTHINILTIPGLLSQRRIIAEAYLL